MFAREYFPAAYWPARYWPQSGEAVTPTQTDTTGPTMIGAGRTFEAIGNSRSFEYVGRKRKR